MTKWVVICQIFRSFFTENKVLLFLIMIGPLFHVFKDSLKVSGTYYYLAPRVAVSCCCHKASCLEPLCYCLFDAIIVMTHLQYRFSLYFSCLFLITRISSTRIILNVMFHIIK